MNLIKLPTVVSEKRSAGRAGFFLFLIMAFGFAVRIFHLGHKELWCDEVSSVTLARNAYNIFSALSYKPLYFLFLKFWIYFFGMAEFAVRLPSVIFGTATIFVIYKLGQEISGRKAGLIAAFLLSISCFHIYQSQQARHFTLMVLLICLSYLCFIRALKGKDAVLNRWLNGGVNVLLVFMHPYALAGVLVQPFFVYGFLERKVKLEWVRVHIVMAVAVALWLLFSEKGEMYYNTLWITGPGWEAIPEVFQTFSYGGLRYGLWDYKVIFGSLLPVNILFLLYCFFLVRGVNFGLRMRDRSRLMILMLGWLLLPMAGALLVSIVRPVFLVKHLIISLPAFCLIVALGIASLRSFQSIMFLLSIVFLLNIYPLMNIYAQDAHIHWRENVLFLKDNIREGDAVVVSTGTDLLPFLYYFGDTPGKALYGYDKYFYCRKSDGTCSPFIYETSHLIIGIPHDMGQGPEAIRRIARERLDALMSRKPMVIWLMAGRWTGQSREQDFAAYLGRSYRLVFKKAGSGVTTYKFEKI